MTLGEYAKLVENSRCPVCKKVFPSPVEVKYYMHSGGWQVDGFREKQWLYLECQCTYQASLWKLGIPGDENPAHKQFAMRKYYIERHMYN